MILESLKQLGQIKKIEDGTPIDVFIEPLKSRNTIYMLFLRIKEEKGNFTFQNLDYEEYSAADYKNWLYRRDKSNNNKYCSPTIKLNSKKLLNNTEKEREIKQIKKRYNAIYTINENLKKEIEKINFEDVILKIKNLNDKKGEYYLSIKVNDIYPYNFELFLNYFKSKVITDSPEKSTKINHSSRGICFLCNKENSIVGDYFPFGFYNKDKPGFFSNLREENSVNAFPICNNCKSTLESGKRVVLEPENHLNHLFYDSLRYFILPVSVTGDLKDFLMIKIKPYSQKLGFFSLLSGSQKRQENELDLLEFLAEMDNSLSFSIYFYEEPQGRSFRILKTIEQRLPSDFNRINIAKKSVENSSYFRELRIMNPNLYLDRDFLIELLKDSDGNFDMNICFNIFSDIFYLKKPECIDSITHDKIKQIYIKIVKNGLPSEKELKQTSLSLLCFRKFFQYINNEVVLMSNSNDLDKFVTETFSSETLRASFILGLMTQLLLNTQRKIRGSEPFLNRLSGFKISVRKIKELAPEVVEKLKWYSIEDSENGGKINNQMQVLNSEFSKYAVNIDKEDYTDVTEISFAFILGMGQLDKLGGN